MGLKTNVNEWKNTSLPLLVLYFGLDIIYGIRGLNLESDGFARKAAQMVSMGKEMIQRNPRLHENLHSSTDTSVCPTK